MNEQQKIVELKIKGKTDEQSSKLNEESWSLGHSGALQILAQAQKSLKKLETDWEVDHGSLTIRDEICFLRYCLQSLERYIKEKTNG